MREMEARAKVKAPAKTDANAARKPKETAEEEREARCADTQMRRAIKALRAVSVVCALLIAICAASCAAESQGSWVGGTQAAGGSYAGSIWDALERGESVDAAIEQAGFKIMDADSAPQWFENEIAPITAFDRVFANSDESIFELQTSGTQEGVLEDMCAHMEKKGWQRTQSSMAGVTTLNKTEGECRWAMLECAETNGECCMVLHIQLG